MTKQGEVGLTDTIISKNNVFQSTSIVNGMRFRNGSAYTLTVSRYSKVANRTDILYQYALSAGDTVLDTTAYMLDYGDILYAKSNVAGTIYVANLI
jgi:hypothetical protein